jgi:hypothetical protein
MGRLTRARPDISDAAWTRGDRPLAGASRVDVRLSGLPTGADGEFATGGPRCAGRTADATGGRAVAPVIECVGSWSKGRVLPNGPPGALRWTAAAMQEAAKDSDA